MKVARTFVVAAVIAGLALLLAAPALAQNEQFFPALVYRTGTYAPNGIPFANGYRDYLMLVNIRDGGINGVRIGYEECETKYDSKLGVECYEKLKHKGGGASVVSPLSTGITYALIPKAPLDKIPVHSIAHGRSDAADGTVFPWIYMFPMTYWGEGTVVLQYIASKEGGLDKLKGKKIAQVFHNSPYGRETIRIFEILAPKYGYEFQQYPVDHPGLEQRATWLQIRQNRPDWVYMRGWGVMNQVAIKEAAANKYLDRMVGTWWAANESDVVPVGDSALGYRAVNFHGAGPDFPVLQQVLKHVYKGNVAEARANNWGDVLYNRGLINTVYLVEAVGTAMKKFGNKPLTGEQVQWGLDHLALTPARLKELGAEGMISPIKVTCEDHEGGGQAFIQQWDGKRWKRASDWITPMYDLLKPLYKESSAKYAKENNVTPRDCALVR